MLRKRLLALTLTYVQIFSRRCRPPGSQIPISAVQLMYLYNFENWILAGAVTLRLITNPRRSRSDSTKTLAIYLWVYAFIALVDGYLELALKLPDGLQDMLWGIPYLTFLGTLAFRREISRETKSFGKWRQTLSLTCSMR